MTLRIDTLKLADDLEAAGDDRRRMARVISDALAGGDTSDLATRGDIAELREETRAGFTAVRGEVAGLRTELKGDIADVELRLTEQIGTVRGEMGSLEARLTGRFYALAFGIVLSNVTLTVALLKLLP
jgi:hypothetical protein